MIEIGEEKCELLGNFAIMIQFFMGLLAISSLAFKRYQEYPPRPFCIWFYDVTKQGIGSLMIHFVNVLLSGISGNESREYRNPCLWYLLNLLMDTTLGVFILYMILNLLQQQLINYKLSEIADSGNYGDPPRFNVFIKQLLFFLTSLCLMKVTVYGLLYLFPFILDLGQFILSPLEKLNDSRYQIILVMLVVPLIMNIFQFCLIDQIIMAKSKYCENISSTNSSPALVPLLLANQTDSDESIAISTDKFKDLDSCSLGPSSYSNSDTLTLNSQSI